MPQLTQISAENLNSLLLPTAGKCTSTDIFVEYNLKRKCSLTIITNIYYMLPMYQAHV